MQFRFPGALKTVDGPAISRRFCSYAACLLLAACAASDSRSPADSELASESTVDSVEVLIARALDSRPEERARLSLLAAQRMENLPESDLDRLQLDQINPQAIDDPVLRLQIVLLSARAAAANGQNRSALATLNSLDIEQLTVPPGLKSQYYQLLGSNHLALGQVNASLSAFIDATAADSNRQLSDAIWALLQSQSSEQLSSLANASSSYEARGWIELARVSRSEQLSIRGQLDAIDQWRRIWAQHSAVSMLPSALQDLSTIWDNRPRRIALLLPLQQPAGLAIQEGFLGAYYQALDISRDVPVLRVYDTSNITDIFETYDQAVVEGAELVIGPLNKDYVNQLHGAADLAVPTLALNYADAPGPGPDNLFQFGLAPEEEITQAISAAWQQGHRNAALLTPTGANYDRLQAIFAQTWSGLGGRLVARTSFSGDSDFTNVIKRLMAIDSSEARADRLLDILPRANMEFTPRRRADIDFIFLMANPRQGRQIKPTLAFYFAENVPVYSMPSIYDGLDNPGANQDLNGIVFTVEPWLLSDDELKASFTSSLRPAQGPLQRLRALGIDSFRLYARLKQLESRQLNSLRGATGILSLSADRRLQRQLQMARFEEGTAIPLASEDISPGD